MDRELIDAIRASAHLLGGGRHDHDALVQMAAGARVVLLGDPACGAHEVHRERVRITQRLIAELGFAGVVWEADWDDAAHAGRWVSGDGDPAGAILALSAFEGFPAWTWRNSAVLEFLEWLRRWNESLPPGPGRAGVYGMDEHGLDRWVHATRRPEEAEHLDPLRGRRAWNLRERYMAESLEALLAYASKDGDARLVVWAHDSHVGDATATERGEAGELSLGQLVRERFGADALLVGFTSYDGTVLAAPEWGGAPERTWVVPALPGSVEALLHEVALPRFFLPLRDPGAPVALRESRLERSLGPVHGAANGEPGSQYFHARLAEQFDAVIHLDRTRAVEPLERTAQPREAGPWPGVTEPALR